MTIFLQWLLLLWFSLFSNSFPANGVILTSTSAYAGAGTNDFTVGTVTWLGINSALGPPDGAVATSTVTTASTTTYYIKLTSFGFTIPGGSTIDGVQVNLYTRYTNSGSGSMKWNAIKLVKDDGSIGTFDNDGDATMPTSLSPAVSFGGAADTWGGDAVTDWNDSDTGIVISCITVGASTTMVAEMDAVQLAITYTDPAGGGNVSPRRSIVGEHRQQQRQQKQAIGTPKRIEFLSLR